MVFYPKVLTARTHAYTQNAGFKLTRESRSHTSIKFYPKIIITQPQFNQTPVAAYINIILYHNRYSTQHCIFIQKWKPHKKINICREVFTAYDNKFLSESLWGLQHLILLQILYHVYYYNFAPTPPPHPPSSWLKVTI